MRTSWALLLMGAVAASACLSRSKGITPVQTDFNKGVYHQSRQDWDAAVHFYRAALREDPDDHRARFNLALTYEEQAATLDTQDPLQTAAADEARNLAAAEYRAILERRPEDLRASVNLAALEIEAGQREAGMRRLDEAAVTHPDVALPHAALGAHRLQAGEVELAEGHLRDAIALDPADTGTNLLLGDCLVGQERFDEAEAAYLRALQTSPASPAVLFSLARLEEIRDRPAEASVWLERMLLVDPDHAESHRMLSRMYEATGDLEGAVLHLWRARALAPPNPADHRRLCALYLLLLEQERADL